MENKKYISVRETAEKWNISDRRVRVLCANNQIEGAFAVGKQWSIPTDAKKPIDKRLLNNSSNLDKLKAIVVAGINNDIGKSLVSILMRNGYKIYGLYSKHEEPAFAPSHNLILKPVDFENRKELIKACKEIDEYLHGFVFTHLYFNLEDIEHFDYDDFEKSFNINVFAPHLLIRELVKKMNYGSSIVLLNSIEAKRGSFGASAYASAQSAKENLVATMSNIFAEMYGVRINSVLSGWIGNMGYDEAFKKAKESIPLKRLGFPEEVAEDIYLMLTRHRYTTGSSLVSDGGYLAVDEQSKTEFLQTGAFYKWLEKFFTSATEKSSIRSISTMMPNEWMDDANERRFREYNIEAMEHGVDFKRIFIFDFSKKEDFKKQKVLMNFVKQTKSISYAADISLIKSKNPKVLDVVGSGLDIFDDDKMVVDYETADVGRGYVSFNKKQINDGLTAFDKLMKIAVPILDVLG